MVNVCVKSYTLCLYFIDYSIFTCVDPDQNWEYGSGSGSTKFMNTDPIRIGIHNTGCRCCGSKFNDNVESGQCMMLSCPNLKSFKLSKNRFFKFRKCSVVISIWLTDNASVTAENRSTKERPLEPPSQLLIGVKLHQGLVKPNKGMGQTYSKECSSARRG